MRQVFTRFLTAAFAAAGLFGCATFGGGASSPREEEVQTVEIPEEEMADFTCAKQIEDVRYKLCDDPPPTLPFDHLSRAKSSWSTFKNRCPEQMRTGLALRRLEKCIDQIEKEPNMLADEVATRRKEGVKKANEIKATEEFGQASRRLKKALRAIEDASLSYNDAYENGDEKEARFQGAIWDDAEEQYRKARSRIEAMMQHVGLDLDDGRYFGMW